MFKTLKGIRIFFPETASFSPYVLKVDCFDTHWYPWVSASLKSCGAQKKSLLLTDKNVEHVHVLTRKQ